MAVSFGCGRCCLGAAAGSTLAALAVTPAAQAAQAAQVTASGGDHPALVAGFVIVVGLLVLSVLRGIRYARAQEEQEYARRAWKEQRSIRAVRPRSDEAGEAPSNPRGAVQPRDFAEEEFFQSSPELYTAVGYETSTSPIWTPPPPCDTSAQTRLEEEDRAARDAARIQAQNAEMLERWHRENMERQAAEAEKAARDAEEARRRWEDHLRRQQ